MDKALSTSVTHHGSPIDPHCTPGQMWPSQEIGARGISNPSSKTSRLRYDLQARKSPPFACLYTALAQFPPTDMPDVGRGRKLVTELVTVVKNPVASIVTAAGSENGRERGDKHDFDDPTL